MTKPDLMAELAEVVRMSARADELSYADEKKAYAYRDATIAALDFITTHHAELEAAVRKCGEYPNTDQIRAAFTEFLSINDGDKDRAHQDLGCFVIGWRAAMGNMGNPISESDQAVTSMHNSAREG